MLLNTSKTNLLTFSLRKKVTTEPITIANTDIAEVESTRLLGVILDQHLTFTKHVDAILSKAKSGFHALVQLKRAGVNTPSLILFYKSRIISVLSYAAPVWYPYLSKQNKELLEKYERLCLKIMLPHIEHYTERLQFCGLSDICVHLDILCLKYVSKDRKSTRLNSSH